jgi:hypothetical protein
MSRQRRPPDPEGLKVWSEPVRTKLAILARTMFTYT